MASLKEIELHHVRIPLIRPFQTSFGTQVNKEGILLKLSTTSGEIGWGEIPLTSVPGYCYETIFTSWYILKDFIIPVIRRKNVENSLHSIDDWINNLKSMLTDIRGHNFAKSGFDFCFWNLKSRIEGKSLPEILGATKKNIPTGISIGIQKSHKNLLNIVRSALEQKYKRIKIKIEPNQDIELIKYLRKELGDFPLMVDANSAYTLSDKDLLLKMDKYDLLMIEQPLSHDDIVDHATLQKELTTPICLDESIHNVDDARKAITSNSCKIINIKAARVGGLTESMKIARYCYENNIGVWCGGMLESGIGRIINIALQANFMFNYPGDTSASKRYFEKDVITPEVLLDETGSINVETKYEINEKIINKYSEKEEIFNLT
ncbi:MAG: o-succinylbenzoate synthase [Candidatus Heimdallarchaeota archaeon LC_3]|nr:MAG: o-succinylbenzoate synthase [Candidatus Heimdallarchaeota archaeon LC_3]